MRCLVLLSLCVLGALAVSPPVHGGAERMRFRAEAQTSTRMTEGEILRRVINWNTVLKGKFPKALKYATGKDLDVNKEMGVEATRGLYFDTQLTRAGRQEAVERFIDEFIKYVDSASKLPGVKWNTNAKAVAANADDVLLNIFRLLFEESFTDPTYYVSHAADHGARVMILAHNYLLNIKGAMKGLQKQLFGSDTDPIHPQSPTENYIWFFMDLANLLHDCGYNGLPKNQSPPQKWTHAVNGAFLLKKRLGALLVDFLPKGHFQKVFDAVRYHNMDNKEKGEMSESGRNGEVKLGQYQPTAWKSRAGLPYAFPDDIDGTQKDTFTHPDVHKVLNDGSSGPDFRVDGVGSLPLGTPNEENSWPKEMWREYKTAQLGSAETELWLLRFADNMDASRGRLTVNQASENAEKCYARLYADEVARRDVCGKWFKADGTPINPKNKDHVAAMQEIKDAAAEAVKTIKATYQPCIDAKKAAATPQEDVISPKQIDARSFLHMYSNWAVEKTGLVSEKDATKVTFAALLSGTGDLAVANYPEVALYQINRMADALQSLTMADGTSVTDFVDVKITGHPLKELAKDTKLSAFNINTANAAKPNKCAIFNKIHQPELACYKDPNAKKTTACVDFHPDLHGAACGAKDPAPPNKYCVIASLV